MSGTKEKYENKLSSNASKVAESAIEMDSLDVEGVKEVTVRSVEIKSTHKYDIVTSAELGGLLVCLWFFRLK